MKSALKWSVLAVCTYLVVLIIKLPAVQVIGRLPLPQDISLQGISGTLWRGQASSVVVQGLPISNVRWQLDVLPLLIGKVSANITAGNIRQSDDITVNGKIAVSGEHLQLHDLQAYLPTSLMVSLLPPMPFPVKAEGRFKLDITQLDYAQDCQALSGHGEWLNAKVAGVDKMIDLGNFDATLQCDQGNVQINVQEPNSFGLSAQVSIPANLKFKISGRFKPDPSLPEEVHQAAEFFGKKDSQGYYQIKF